RNQRARSDAGEQDEQLDLPLFHASHELEQGRTARERCLPERGRTPHGSPLPHEHGREFVSVSSFEDDDTYAGEWTRERHGATLRPNTAACQAQTLTADERTSRRRTSLASSSAFRLRGRSPR